MKTKYFFAVIVLMAAMLTACEDDNVEVTYKGTVINSVTREPFPALEVSVTDGEHINQTVHTDAAGFFSLLVRFNEINKNYYLLVGDSSCAPVRKEFKGFGQSEIDLGIIEVEGPKAPVVSTTRVSGITAESAVSGGNVTDDGRATITARGVCWSKAEYPTINDNFTTNGTGKGAYESKLTNLEFGATYYVRAYATNRIGTSYGEQVTFTTNTGMPAVTTDTLSNILATSATCGGTVGDNSGYQITARGICWSDKTATPTTDDSHTTEVAMTGHFSSMMIGLEKSTTYYVRAYAVNEIGTGYGETMMFTTLSGLPTITTDSISAIHTTTATCYSNITTNGGYPITARGVCWSTASSTPTLDDNHTNDVVAEGSISSLLTGLDANTTYYVRAYATNEVGTAYGESLNFTSGNGLPTVETTSVGENITSSSITTGGNVVDDGGFAITARGVVYGTVPFPTIENNAYTTDGTGVGYYGSSITDVYVSSNTYYIRAYATNEKGTAYGEQEVVTPEKYDYCILRSMVYGGYTYKIKFLGSMSWTDGNTACENMVYGGYDDWFMPNEGEVQGIIEAYGKWNIYYSSSSNARIEGCNYLWTSKEDGSSYAYIYYVYNSYWRYCDYSQDKSDIYGVFAVRRYRTDK